MTTQTLHLIDDYIIHGSHLTDINGKTLLREAHLVAAAPDLLAALEDAVAALADANYYPSELKRMQSVIAKAKGA
jgi:hypothetical protein